MGEAVSPVVGPRADLAVGRQAMTQVVDHLRLLDPREAVGPIVGAHCSPSGVLVREGLQLPMVEELRVVDDSLPSGSLSPLG